MNQIAKEIRDYWNTLSPYFTFDVETLDSLVPTLTKDETLILQKGYDACCKEAGIDKDTYLYAVHKAFNRHNDIICGYTIIEDGTVICSEKSSITELDISIETLRNCNKNCIYHVCDVEKTILPTLTLDAIADLTAAIIEYNAIHNVNIA